MPTWKNVHIWAHKNGLDVNDHCLKLQKQTSLHVFDKNFLMIRAYPNLTFQ